METLIYFFQSNSAQDTLEPNVKEYARKDYRLVRIGLSREAIALIEREEISVPESGRRRFFWKKARRKRQEKMLAEQKFLLQKIQAYWGDELTTYCICAPQITYFNRWRFSEFRETVWVERLLNGVELPHFLVLGYCRNLREILFLHARRMKSLKICVCEKDGGDRMEQEIETLAEDLYEEYGLTAAVSVLTGKNSYGNARNLMPVGCNVLDFSGEKYFHPQIVPAGSVWYDMDADEEKRRGLAERTVDISYKSLTVP